MSARFVLDGSVALQQFDALKQLGVRISYSVKTNHLIAQLLEKEKAS